MRLATVDEPEPVAPGGQAVSHPAPRVGHECSLVVTFDRRDGQSSRSHTAIVSTSSSQRELESSTGLHTDQPSADGDRRRYQRFPASPEPATSRLAPALVPGGDGR